MEPQAQSFYNILAAIFDHVDTTLEPKGLGLWTIEREREVLILTDQPESAESMHVIEFHF